MSNNPNYPPLPFRDAGGLISHNATALELRSNLGLGEFILDLKDAHPAKRPALSVLDAIIDNSFKVRDAIPRLEELRNQGLEDSEQKAAGEIILKEVYKCGRHRSWATITLGGIGRVVEAAHVSTTWEMVEEVYKTYLISAGDSVDEQPPIGFSEPFVGSSIHLAIYSKLENIAWESLRYEDGYEDYGDYED